MQLFPSSLDGNAALSYVQLSQGIADFAAKSKGIRQKENDSPNEKFHLRTWLVRIGFVGEEFKYARKLLTENLSGNSAWLRKGVDAVQPKEMSTAELQREGVVENIPRETAYISQEEQQGSSEAVSFEINSEPENPPSPAPAEEESETEFDMKL